MGNNAGAVSVTLQAAPSIFATSLCDIICVREIPTSANNKAVIDTPLRCIDLNHVLSPYIPILEIN